MTIGGVSLAGELGVPAEAKGLVVFAHGSGSSRRSPRNQLVAKMLRDSNLGTLLFDLLTPEEAEDRRNVFDIPLLAQRVLMGARWALTTEETSNLSLGIFGASTGAAAALVAAAQEPLVRAVVSRGGRPDLAGPWLSRVSAPTLLIVGELDREVLLLNEAAMERLRCEKHLTIVPGATHLFEEPGTLEMAASHARDWFVRYLIAPRATPG